MKKYIEIKIDYKEILKSKGFKIILALTLLFLLNFILYNYTNIYNPFKKTIINKYISFKIEKDSEEFYKSKYIELTNEYNEKIKKINEEYIQNIAEVNKNIQNAKNLYKKEILNNSDQLVTLGVKNIVGHDFEYDIHELIDKNISAKELVRLNFINKIKLSQKENKDILKIINLNSKNKEQSKIPLFSLNNLLGKIGERKVVKPKEVKVVKFNIIEEEKKDNGIIILNRDGLQNILPYGISFPSFFSYKANGITVLRGYLDLHYGVDYITRPYVYLNLYNFKNKPNKVIISKISGSGNKVVLANINNNGSERYEYLHLSKINVKQGQELKGGEKIGVTGKSGYITGPHLHFQVYKNGFYVPYDWGLDFDNAKTLELLNFDKEQIPAIIKLGKQNNINLELALAIYNILDKEKRTIDNLKIIIKGMIEEENNNKYGYTDYLQNKNIKALFSEKQNNVRENKKKMIKFIDKLHKIKIDNIKTFLSENKKDIEKYLLFDTNLIGNNYKIKTKDIKGLIDYKECSDYKSKVFDQYIKYDIDIKQFFTNKQIENTNKIIPLILQEIENKKIPANIEKYNHKINKCDILFLELGKWKYGNDMTLKYNKNGIFYNLSKEYEKREKVFNTEEIKQQIQDSLDISYKKLLMLFNIQKEYDLAVNKDFVLKFWLWSFNGINGQTPNDDYYTTNYLFKNKIDKAHSKKGTFLDVLIFYFNK